MPVKIGQCRPRRSYDPPATEPLVRANDVKAISPPLGENAGSRQSEPILVSTAVRWAEHRSRLRSPQSCSHLPVAGATARIRAV